jgi:hypothetical protein
MTTLRTKSREALQMWVRLSMSPRTLFAKIGRFRRWTLPYLELIRIDPA